MQHGPGQSGSPSEMSPQDERPVPTVDRGDDLDPARYGEQADEPRRPLLTSEEMAEIEAAEAETIERWMREEQWQS